MREYFSRRIGEWRKEEERGEGSGQTNRKMFFEDSPKGLDCFISVVQRTRTSKQIITFHFQREFLPSQGPSSGTRQREGDKDLSIPAEC